MYLISSHLAVPPPPWAPALSSSIAAAAAIQRDGAVWCCRVVLYVCIVRRAADTAAGWLRVVLAGCRAREKKRGRNKINNLSADAAGAVAQAGGIGGWGPMAAHVCLRLTDFLDLNFHIRLSVTEHRRPSGPLALPSGRLPAVHFSVGLVGLGWPASPLWCVLDPKPCTNPQLHTKSLSPSGPTWWPGPPLGSDLT